VALLGSSFIFTRNTAPDYFLEMLIETKMMNVQSGLGCGAIVHSVILRQTTAVGWGFVWFVLE